MAVILGTFLFNLLCGLVPCDPNYGIPEIKQVGQPLRGLRSSSYLTPEIDKNDIEAKVVVTQGKIEGYHMKTMGGRTIFAFEGIPYGEPPVGFYRFKPPVAKKGWTGTLKALKPGSDCLQISIAKLIRVYGEESCLYLNIFTPNLPSKQKGHKYPVIFYIHGGSFIMGAGSEHGPSYMLDRDVVLVTINYRLGVLGFMSTGNSDLPGNYGLKDQSLALNWVYDNIEKFGGGFILLPSDRNNINLWGHSAGSVSVHLHMISNVTRHLFTKGVSISGTAMNHWGVHTRERARSWTNRMGKYFRCPTEDSKTLANCLQKISSISLVAAQLKLFEWFPFPPTMFSPTIEDEGADAFLTETPEEAYERGHVAKKPWVTSMTSREGQTAILVLELLLKYSALKVNWRTVAPIYLDLSYIAKNPTEIVDKVTKFYLKGKSIRDASVFEVSDMLSDRYFLFGIHKGIQAHFSIAPTYSYYFSFSQGNHNLGNYFGHSSPEWGPGHAEDDYYFFNCSTQYPPFKQSDPDYKMSKIMINLLTNFVTKGEPTYNGGKDGAEMKVWNQVTNVSDIRVLQMDTDVKMIEKPHLERLRFWQDLHLEDMIPWKTL